MAKMNFNDYGRAMAKYNSWQMVFCTIFVIRSVTRNAAVTAACFWLDPRNA